MPEERVNLALMFAVATGRVTRPRKPVVNVRAKCGRNEKCLCGSGIKFKRCCLAKETRAEAPRYKRVLSDGQPVLKNGYPVYLRRDDPLSPRTL